MPTNLEARMAKVERILPDPRKRPRWERVIFKVMYAEGDDEAGYALARSHGWCDDDEDHLLIALSIVSPPSKPKYDEPPRMLLIPAGGMSKVAAPAS